MSHRQRVKQAVIALCTELGRAVTLEEIRTRLDAEAPVHLDAVCGSLVRTGDLQTQPARRWERERRNVYGPAGIAMTVDEDATEPSRPEIVAAAVVAIWAQPTRGNVPISSREIRGHLKSLRSDSELTTQRTLLPTALNALSKTGGNGPPIVDAVSIPQVRAQRWVPHGAAWRLPTGGTATTGTKADQVSASIRTAMAAGGRILITQDDVGVVSGSSQAGSLTRTEMARQLSDTTRAVQSGRGNRVQRRHPHVIQLGEVDGRAVYTLPEFMADAAAGQLSPAVAAFEWCRCLEDWETGRVANEVAQLAASRASAHLVPLRTALVRAKVEGFGVRYDRLLEQSPAIALEDPAYRQVSKELESARATLGRMPIAPEGVSESVTESTWLSASEAVELLCRDFQLGSIPSHVVVSFLRDEVVRRRNPRYTGRTGQRGGFDCRWEYEIASLRYAGAARWGSPDVMMLARQGMHILGPVRSFKAVQAAITTCEWSAVDVAAATGMLGNPEAYQISERLVAAGLEGVARRWVALAIALIRWQVSPAGRSPWRQTPGT